jgi:hypothetical protein
MCDLRAHTALLACLSRWGANLLTTSQLDRIRQLDRAPSEPRVLLRSVAHRVSWLFGCRMARIS